MSQSEVVQKSCLVSELGFIIPQEYKLLLRGFIRIPEIAHNEFKVI